MADRAARRAVTLRHRLRVLHRRAMLSAVVALSLLAASCSVADSQPPVSCTPHPVFDDFVGPPGNVPNPELWNYQLGGGGSNGQLQVYTNFPRNASLDGNGNLAINALKESLPVPRHGVFDYTSARIHTLGRLNLCYGRLSARIKFPIGAGLRPAFWLLGADCGSVGWPRCGEIDVMDVGHTMSGAAVHGAGFQLLGKAPFDVRTDFHEYWMAWDRDRIVTGIDGQELASWTPAQLPPGTSWPFNDRPMFVILNVAVGGDEGPPDAFTQFPATMLVDWIRYTPPG